MVLTSSEKSTKQTRWPARSARGKCGSSVSLISLRWLEKFLSTWVCGKSPTRKEKRREVQFTAVA